MDFSGNPLVIEPWPGQLSRNAGLLPLRQFYQRMGLTRASVQPLDDPGGADLPRGLLPGDSAKTGWQQNGNNVGDVSPTCLQCSL
jgi:hypothetical protein